MSNASMLSKEQFDAFARLAARLSPENLSCDGELSKADQEREAARIRTQWKELENAAGCGQFSVDEIEEEHLQRLRANRRYGL